MGKGSTCRPKTAFDVYVACDAGISSGLSESNRLRADSRDVASCHNNFGTIVFNTETQSRAETNLRSTMGDDRAVLFRVII